MEADTKNQTRKEIFAHNPYTNRVVNIEPLFFHIAEYHDLPSYPNQEIDFSMQIEGVLKTISKDCNFKDISHLEVRDIYNILWTARDIFKEMNELKDKP